MSPLIVSIIFFFWSQYLVGIDSARLGQVKVTNITCESLDDSLAIISQCEMIKMANTRTSISVYIKLNQRIENLTVHAKLLRLVNKQYKAFLYDDQIDFCQFIASDRRHFFWGHILNLVAKSSNVNHSCPYEDSLILKNFVLDGQRIKVLPLPKGEYKIDILVTVLKSPMLQFVFLYMKT